MVNILNPLDRLALARNHLQASRSYAAAVIDRIRQVEVLLGPTCRDTVTAVVELRGVLTGAVPFRAVCRPLSRVRGTVRHQTLTKKGTNWHGMAHGTRFIVSPVKHSAPRAASRALKKLYGYTVLCVHPVELGAIDRLVPLLLLEESK